MLVGLVAPLAFYAADEVTGTHVLIAQFPISRDGGELMVNAGLKYDVWSAVVAGGFATASGTVSKITVNTK